MKIKALKHKFNNRNHYKHKIHVLLGPIDCILSYMLKVRLDEALNQTINVETNSGIIFRCIII